MSRHNPYSGGLLLPRYSPDQIMTLDAIGTALAEANITWDEAVALRDRVRLGGTRYAKNQLAKFRRAA